MVIPFNVTQKCVNLDLVNVIPTLKLEDIRKSS